jgi:hypothetical protein
MKGKCERWFCYSVFSFGFMKIRSARNAVYRKAEPVSSTYSSEEPYYLLGMAIMFRLCQANDATRGFICYFWEDISTL